MKNSNSNWFYYSSNVCSDNGNVIHKNYNNKKENANAIWIYNGIFILILSIGLVVVLIAGIKMKNAGMIARGLSLAALIYTFTLELIKTLKLYYNKIRNGKTT